MAAAVHSPPTSSSSSSSSATASAAAPPSALDALAARVAGAVELTLADRLVWSLIPRNQGQKQGSDEGWTRGVNVGDVVPVWHGPHGGTEGMWLTAVVLNVTPAADTTTTSNRDADDNDAPPGEGCSYTVRYLCDHAVETHVGAARVDSPGRDAEASVLVATWQGALQGLRPLLPGPRGRDIVTKLLQVGIYLRWPVLFAPPLTHSIHVLLANDPWTPLVRLSGGIDLSKWC